MTDVLDDLIARVYGSLTGPEGHAEFVRALARAFRSHLIAVQVDAPEHQHAALAHYDDLGRSLPPPAALASDHAYVNPWFASQMIERLFREGVAGDEGVVEPAELRRSDFYADILRPLDVFHSAGLQLEPRFALGLSISRSHRVGYYTRHELELGKALLPHLQNVHAIQRALALHGLPMESGSSRAVWLLLASGSICSRNRIAQQTMGTTAAVLIERQHRLFPANHSDRHAFSTLLTEVLSGNRLHGQTPLRDYAGIPRCVAHVHRCQREAFLEWLLDDPPVALVSLQRLDCDSTSLAETLSQFFGLSRAECRVAVKLMELGSLRSVAIALSRSEETVRTQLKSIFVKTGSNSQARLIKLLCVLSGQ